jgi:histidinol phosphatase-like PHP family hydrolase
MRGVSLANRDLSELCALASEREEGTKAKALRRTARSALMWPEEARDIVAAGRSLTELRSVGPYVERILMDWLSSPPEVPEPPAIRLGFVTLAEARAVLAAYPARRLRADLQMHTLYSDGTAPVEAMVEACAGYAFVAITDHSKGLKIANGMDEERLALQGLEIEAVNASSKPPRTLKAIEMNLNPAGEGDMDPDALARLDLVLGAFHSKLRTKDDQTDRYLAALRNRTVDVLAHPRGRIFNFRLGLQADWERVFSEAAAEGIALEIDCYPDRQDLNVELLRVARDHDVTFSIGTDAHSIGELAFIDIGLAAAILAEIPPERVLNETSPEAIAERRAARRNVRPRAGG